MNALEFTGRSIETSRIALVGAGAANSRTAMLLIAAGVPPGNIVLVDKNGILNQSRHDLSAVPLLKKLCRITNSGNLSGGIAQAMRGADAVCAASACGPGVIKPEWVGGMAKNPVVFSLANPVPEIMPGVARTAGAAVVGTGRGDFPNQINNCLAFPGIFRGVLDCRASAITDEMCVSAACAIAEFAKEKGLERDRIVPSLDDTGMFARVAAKTATAAIRCGVARIKLPESKFYDMALKRILRAQKETRLKIKSGLVG